MKQYFFIIASLLLTSCVGEYSTENYVETPIFDDINGGLYVDGTSTSYGIDAIDSKLKDLGFTVQNLSNDDKLYELNNPSEELMRILTYNVFDEEIYKATKNIIYEVEFSPTKGYLRFMTVELNGADGRWLELSHANKVHSNDRLADMCETSVESSEHTVYCNKELYGFWNVDDHAALTCVPFVYNYD